MKKLKAIHKKRLLNVARALRESPKPEKFDMTRFAIGECGTPACALGHYAARRDLQRVLKLKLGESWFGPWWAIASTKTNRQISLNGTLLQKHFGISARNLDELFEGDGCGKANTAIQAAKYIDSFVKARS
jgi:hypothetical protein